MSGAATFAFSELLELDPDEITRAGLRVAGRGLASQSSTLEWVVIDEPHQTYLHRGDTRIPFLRTLPHQQASVDSPCRYKMLRYGRRTGKTREAWIMAVRGHGPQGFWAQGEGVFERQWHGPKWRGIMHDMDVVWLARDHKQGDVLWKEEIKPKFKGKPGVYVNEIDRCITLEGLGSLYVRTNENIDSVRGIGDRLVGVIVDEAAWLDLKYALESVLLPALMDNEGWVVCMSTTNAGSDGAKERPIGPSYFNMLCQAIQDSEIYRQKTAEGQPVKKPELYRDENWGEWHATAADNPRITPQAFAELKALYAEGSVAWSQEGLALLLESLEGVAFPEWRDNLHVRAFDINQIRGWVWRAGLDDGFSSAGRLTLGAFGPNGRDHLHAELSYNGNSSPLKNLPPLQVGELIGRFLQQYPLPDRIDADEAMWATGDGRGGTRQSVAELVQQGINNILKERAPLLVKAAKGAGSRGARARLLHQSLRWVEVDQEQPDGSIIKVVPAWGMPKFSVHPRCQHFITSIKRLPVDPADADCYATKGVDDHSVDSWTYLIQSRPDHADLLPRRRSEHAAPSFKEMVGNQGQEPPRMGRYDPRR